MKKTLLLCGLVTVLLIPRVGFCAEDKQQQDLQKIIAPLINLLKQIEDQLETFMVSKVLNRDGLAFFVRSDRLFVIDTKRRAIVSYKLDWTLSPEAHRDMQEDFDTLMKPESTGATPPPMPTTDVMGMDLPDIPRYPGAIRTKCRTRIMKDRPNVREVTVTYQVMLSAEKVAQYYMSEMSRKGWRTMEMNSNADAKHTDIDLQFEKDGVEYQVKISGHKTWATITASGLVLIETSAHQ